MLLLLLAPLLLLPALPARASSAVAPRPFAVELHPETKPHYDAPRGCPLVTMAWPLVRLDCLEGFGSDDHDFASVRSRVVAADGVEIFVETWFPAQKEGGPPVPERIPTILVPTPYAVAGFFRNYYYGVGRDAALNGIADHGVVPYGYAWSVMHLRGTGASGGCLAFGSETEADDVARVVEHILDQPWSDGTVGGFGDSHDAAALLNAAARRDRATGEELFDAIVAIAPGTSWYDSHWTFDGVRLAGVASASVATYHTWIAGSTTGRSPVTGRETGAAAAIHQRPGCLPDATQAAADPSGDFSAWYAERDVRRWAPNITSPVLMTHGHYDLTPAGGSPPSQQAGLFDRLGGPKAGLFGLWGHEAPDWKWASGLYEELHRTDFPDMRTAWFEHWVRGRDSGVEEWPVAQVQDSDGQWRAEPDWPATGGRVGRLTLAPGGVLGGQSPSGDSSYREGPLEVRGRPVPGSYLEFTTPPLPDRLQITGQPVLDLVVRLEDHDPLRERDSHIAARLEVLDAGGQPVGQKGNQAQRTHATFGLRSARHLDPMPNGFFEQSEGREPPAGWFEVPVRFQPTDLVVPAGGRLRVTIAGSLIPGAGADQVPPYFVPGWGAVRGAFPTVHDVDDPLLFFSLPSGSTPTVRISHDCGIGVSALRFLMPDEQPDLLDVAEWHDEPLGDEPARTVVSDGGGLATADICGAIGEAVESRLSGHKPLPEQASARAHVRARAGRGGGTGS